ncbi:MAG: alpha/beta fold hydrolase [Bdellovibrionaceae bacterium]|nr:alpha/beta fold hydrolase [Pseudobdellovibrionaceae bacterium]
MALLNDNDIAGLTQFKIPVHKLAPLQTVVLSPGKKLSYRLYFSSHFDIKKPAVLNILIHGMGGDSRYFAQLAHGLTILNDQVVVLTPDLPGHGPHIKDIDVQNQHPEVQDPESIVRYLEIILQKNMEQSFSNLSTINILGHSLGAGVALKWAYQSKRVFHKMVLVAPYLSLNLNIEGPLFDKWIQKEQDGFRLLLNPKLKFGSEVEFYHNSYLSSCLLDRKYFIEFIENSKKVTIVASSKDFIVDFEQLKKTSQEWKVNFIQEENLSHLGLVTSPEMTSKYCELLQDE